MTVEANPPLHGVRVIEIAGEASAFAGRQLAELGAEVILVESSEGASARKRQPFLDGVPDIERSLYHLHFNAGKRSVLLDLKSNSGVSDLRRLVHSADVLIESMTPGFMDALGIGFESLRIVNPQMLYVTITPFGQDGPFAEYRGNDLIGAASSGLMYLNGFPEDPPNLPGAEQANHMASLAAVSTLLVAVVGRERSDRHSHRIDISVQEAASVSTLQTANANLYGWHRTIPKRFGIAPTSQGGRSLFKCADGKWISFVVPHGAPKVWPNFVAWMEQEGLIASSDERFADPSFRAKAPDVVSGLVEQLCGRYPRSEIFTEGQRRRMLAMPVNDARDLLEDEHLQVREFFTSVTVPQSGHDVIDVSAPYRFSETPALRGLSAPVHGADSAEILAGLPAIASPARSEAVSKGHHYRPLAGIRVCDFTWMLAGPLTTRVLADYGADVIKIESESRIDTIRLMGAQPSGTGSINTNGVYNDASANKRAIRLNLNTSRGIELAKELVAKSDIVTNNYTPDRMDRWGLGYEDLRKIKSDIIMLTLPVMGGSGPYRGYGSYGNGVIAYGGLSSNMGFEDRAPVGIAPLYSDFAAPYSAVSALMSALFYREKTGVGQFIELSQAEATINLMGTGIMEAASNGDLPPRIGNRSRDVAPHGAFPCLGDDRWIAITCESDDDWQRLTNVLAAQELMDDPRFATNFDRLKHEEALEDEIGSRTKEREVWELMHELQAETVMAAVVEDLEDMVTRDLHLQRHLVPVQGDDDGLTFLTHAQPARIDGKLAPIKRSPRWGEHDTEVYRDILGLTESEIVKLTAAEVIF